jgi:uncharacterized membrane protein
MQWHNATEATRQENQEYNDRTEYMHGYEPSSDQIFQEQTSHPPLAGYGPNSYGQQGQPQFAGNPPLSDTRFAAILSYSFGWLTGILFLLFGGRTRFVRFHALQALVFFGAINLIDVGLFIFMAAARHQSHYLLFGSIVLFLLLNFIAFVSWIVVMVQTARGIYFRLPFVGELVAQCFGLHARPRW